MRIAIPKDNRGKHKSRPYLINKSTLTLVKNHIASFSKQESHFGRSKSEKEYLSSDFHLTRIYNAYLKQHPEVLLSKSSYGNIFKEHFNLQFGQPSTNTCTHIAQ